jgi:predicted secreted protein
VIFHSRPDIPSSIISDPFCLQTYENNGGGHGSGGTFTFTLNAVEPGHGSIFLKYARNWTGTAANTFLVSWHNTRPTIAENEDM